MPKKPGSAKASFGRLLFGKIARERDQDYIAAVV
jgi:hypothetical protein